VNTRTGALIAVGEFAEKMTGRTPDYIRVVRPVSGGTVVDIEMAQRMLRHLLGDKMRRALRRKPILRAAACTPHDADPLAQRAAIETLVGLGARRVELVDTLIAAAVGCGLPAGRRPRRWPCCPSARSSPPSASRWVARPSTTRSCSTCVTSTS
jgi:rod shape-determining protein MreB